MADDATNAASVRISGNLADSAREILAGSRPPAVPKDAATVMLLRQSSAGLVVYMLKRKSTMAFAPGAYVFPGGSVDSQGRR